MGEKFSECLYDYKEKTRLTPENIAKARIKILEKENEILLKEKELLLNVLKKINDGFKVEYGHSDADRHCKNIKYWNKIIIETLKEIKK